MFFRYIYLFFLYAICETGLVEEDKELKSEAKDLSNKVERWDGSKAASLE
jgi:hypothetical protein